MNSIGDIMKGGISAILIVIGYVVLWCGILCLLFQAFGRGNGAPEMLLWCGIGCVIFSLIMGGSGTAWYYIVKPKA
ncbi:hypothetical protein LCGC14_1135590 [marine sediment metagenome]|uniref:Uncharacterized protein n=1 Tax=marine sediment metagenome TaxID=412755 RepID=A0A0F9M4P8_9ZZZZ